MVRGIDGKEDVLDVINTDVPFLCGKKALEQWGYILNSRNGILATLIKW